MNNGVKEDRRRASAPVLLKEDVWGKEPLSPA